MAAPVSSVPMPLVRASEDSVTRTAGVVLWGPLLDRLGLAAEADRRQVRPIGLGGYTGGECYRPLVEMIMAGGDFLSDRSLLADEATQRLRGSLPLPSHTTSWRFLAGADLGRVSRIGAVNREMLRRAWAMGAAPERGLLTIDPDATIVPTYGPGKEGSTFTYTGEVGMQPMVGVIAETGEVIAVRARKGSAHPGRGLGSFVAECVQNIPVEVRSNYQLWVRIDSAGYQRRAVEACEATGAVWTITAHQKPNVRRVICELMADPHTVWRDAKGDQTTKMSQVADTLLEFAGRTVRLIVRRQPVAAGQQLSMDDLDAYRFHAIITNIPAMLASAVDVEAHHRLRGGVPEETIKMLKHDFAFSHAPLENFFGNWCWWHACALAYNVTVWMKTLALPRELRRCHGKRLRLDILNLPARVTRSGRRLHLNLPRAYQFADAFIAALNRIRALPAFG